MRPADSVPPSARSPAVGWALLVVGYAITWISVTVTAVSYHREWTSEGAEGHYRRSVSGEPGGWRCALEHEPTYPLNIAIALLPLVFVLWRWRLNPIWRVTGLAVSGGAFIGQALIFAFPAEHGITTFRLGFWLWVLGPAVMGLAFALAPSPGRVDEDSGLVIDAPVATRADWSVAATLTSLPFFLFSYALPALELTGAELSGFEAAASSPDFGLTAGLAVCAAFCAWWFAWRNRDPVWRRAGLGLGAAGFAAAMALLLVLERFGASRPLIGWYVWLSATLVLLLALWLAPGTRNSAADGGRSTKLAA